MGRERTFETQGSRSRQKTGAACKTDGRITAFVLLFLSFSLIGDMVAPARAQVPELANEQFEDPDRSDPIAPADDPKAPRRHFRIKDPAQLSDTEATQVYAQLKAQMAARYALSRYPGISDYQNWMRLNRVPYRSASHGQRYLNNYANETARDYARFEEADTLPVGAILVKDSITIRSDGSVMPGALFLMEKMPDGFNHASGNWRYTMIMPDGSIFGTTGGIGAKQVQFCISCHLAVEHQDHLFFIPEEYRRSGGVDLR